MKEYEISIRISSLVLAVFVLCRLTVTPLTIPGIVGLVSSAGIFYLMMHLLVNYSKGTEYTIERWEALE